MKCVVHTCVCDAVGTKLVEAEFDMPIADDDLIAAEAMAGVRGLYAVTLRVGFCAGHCDLLGIPADLLDELPVDA